MHHVIVEKLIRSKILFFDSNPIGRIFTRFSKDMSCLDIILSGITGLASFSLFRTLSVTITIISIYPQMLPIVALAFFLMIWVIKKALATQRECLRMDSIYRGPIHSMFAMIVNGLVSLRTFERIPFFRIGFID
jgi:ABC-type multidrug transport system fused ATPase/permease subunit